MKLKNWLSGVIGCVTFLLLTWIIPSSKKIAGSVNYAPDGFKKTIDASIDGIVVAVKQEGLYWVTINRMKLPFSYDEYKLPDGWKGSYPNDFIQVGDKIYKHAKSDTFYLMRNSKKWQYILPQ